MPVGGEYLEVVARRAHGGDSVEAAPLAEPIHAGRTQADASTHLADLAGLLVHGHVRAEEAQRLRGGRPTVPGADDGDGQVLELCGLHGVFSLDGRGMRRVVRN